MMFVQQTEELSMKTYLTTALCLSALAAASAQAAPAPKSTPDDGGFFFKPYVGADYQYTSVDYNGVPGTPYNYGDGFADSFNGGDVHIGARVHKYLGFEAGYFDNASSSKTIANGLSSSVKFDGWTIDALGYLPLAAKFELIGTTGVAFTSASGSAVINGTRYSLGSSSETEWRIGGGAEYWITENLNARGILRYQTADFNGIADNAVVASLGLNYQF
jgi:Outer membrane protein beta-barrel domain